MMSRIFLVLCCSVVMFSFLDSDVFAQLRRKGTTNKTKSSNYSTTMKKEAQKINDAQQKKSEGTKASNWWQKLADKNQDGNVDMQELEAWKKLERERIDLNGDGVVSPKEKRLCWRHARSKVNTNLERKYDQNGNGWLETNEVKELLKSRYKYVKSNGKASVDSSIEEGYDADANGIIDSKEAQALNEDAR